ncbi:hypothetical protein NVP1236O_58 [Vibrio phage 1.236.O._10N.261.52.C4]|nr:hypothetical protein NVP1236O_58 [Vibrio phage 1.236.O._10N.261.52.C4]
MELMKYTYEEIMKRNQFFNNVSLTKTWLISNRDGRKIAEATSEKQAKLITDALNR